MHTFGTAFLCHLFSCRHSPHLPVFCGFVFAMPELILRQDDGNFVKVVLWHRRRYHPLQATGIPRVGAGGRSGRRASCSSATGENVDEYQQDANSDDKSPHGRYGIPKSEAVFGGVCGDSPRHPLQS